MNIQENIKKILREERNHSKLIVKLLNRLVVSKYEDVCKIEVVHPSVDSDYDFYRVFVYFNQHGKNGTKYWEENILDEVWQYVYDTFGISIALHSVRVISCDDDNSNMNIQENIRRVLREEMSPRQEKISLMIRKLGIFRTAKVTGGFKRLLDIMGKDFLDKESKIELIGDIVDLFINGYLSVISDLNSDIIPFTTEDGNKGYIEAVKSKTIIATISGVGYSYKTNIDYKYFPDDLIDKILSMVVDHYDAKF